MATSAKVVEIEALALPQEDRTRLAVHLIESIENRPDANPQQVERAWLAEANRRYQAFLRGEEKAIPEEDSYKN